METQTGQDSSIVILIPTLPGQHSSTQLYVETRTGIAKLNFWSELNQDKTALPSF